MGTEIRTSAEPNRRPRRLCPRSSTGCVFVIGQVRSVVSGRKADPIRVFFCGPHFLVTGTVTLASSPDTSIENQVFIYRNSIGNIEMCPY